MRLYGSIMLPHGWTLRRRLGAALAGLLLGAIVGGVPLAAAGSIAYIDGNEVWVSSFDGSRKERLSSGENEWRTVAAADNGRVIGERIEAGKISQLSRLQLWESNGQVISQGPLPSKSGWTSYVAPLSLDLTADGIFAIYGYSGQRGLFPTATFEKGHYAILSDTKANLEPIGQTGYTWPTTFGRRVVAASGSQVVVQAADSSNPFWTTWSTLLDSSGTGLELHRADVAANGKLVGLELTGDSGATEKVGVISIAGVDAPATFPAAVDCYLPAAGKARGVTFSQDGTQIAWKDEQGVKIAGVPTTAADPCVFSSPPIVISATGSSPSIGGADIAQLRPPAPTPPTPAPAPAPPPGIGPGAGGSPSVSVLTKGSAAALAGAKGLTLKVSVLAAGKVTATGSIAAKRLGLKGGKAIVVATGSARAAQAGTVSVRLRLTKKARKYRKRLKGATIVLRITQGGRTTTMSVKLR